MRLILCVILYACGLLACNIYNDSLLIPCPDAGAGSGGSGGADDACASDAGPD